MNIETKSVRGNYDEYLKFGWEHTQDSPARSGRSHYTAHILARDKDMENHRLIETLEKKVFLLKIPDKNLFSNYRFSRKFPINSFVYFPLCYLLRL